jgi:hypothetical protein
MASFVALTTASGTNDKIWVNADLITSIRPGERCTVIHFDKDHFLAVDEPIDRILLQLSTSPLSP